MILIFFVVWGCVGWAAACFFAVKAGARKYAIESAPSASHNSAMPKYPAPVPCEDVMPGRVCGRVPKCFSRYGTSA